ncbi:GntR family transcriptional regulator [Agreia sp. VKM Ac-1783]|uniref:GntR family transcriptional regulator n=1 Tax=Agreia sp. VKM Ac-1783 TaxID=1938889 RepID=UPI000A2AE16C|nr:GntR family transcriptional regulator [Agreia sp. VKM Ac-1783]SMQ74961.1 DNA-binding transcriptional regulator YhcF, GntR family [Agreia sp. VKM Ac-1783]
MITVHPNSGIPPYEQIRRQLQELIHTGQLLHGTRLPTVRRLAADLGLASNTVARAYRELESDGIVETRGRAGTIVAFSNDQARSDVEMAAADFAALTRRLGVQPTHAIQMVEIALREATA